MPEVKIGALCWNQYTTWDELLSAGQPIMRGMLRGEEPTATGPRYAAKAVRNLPAPVQEHLPLLVGGGGERVTLKLVARYADANNVGGTAANIARKEAILVEDCERLGRDPEIERTCGMGVVVIRDSRDEARRVYAGIVRRNGNSRPWENQPVGTPEDVAAHIAERRAIGYHHLIAGFPPPTTRSR